MLQDFVHIASLGPCIPPTLIILKLHLQIKLFKIDSNKNLVLSVPHFLMQPLMITGDEPPSGHVLFNRKNKKDVHVLLQLVPCTKRKEKNVCVKGQCIN